MSAAAAGRPYGDVDRMLGSALVRAFQFPTSLAGLMVATAHRDALSVPRLS